jgi:hypothetical protein
VKNSFGQWLKKIGYHSVEIMKEREKIIDDATETFIFVADSNDESDFTCDNEEWLAPLH